jgi:hypothetical protein
MRDLQGPHAYSPPTFSGSSHQVEFSPNGVLGLYQQANGFRASLEAGFIREPSSVEASDHRKFVFYSSDGTHLIVGAEWVTVHEVGSGRRRYSISDIKEFGSLALSRTANGWPRALATEVFGCGTTNAKVSLSRVTHPARSIACRSAKMEAPRQAAGTTPSCCGTPNRARRS